jgi:hypothetical protein
MDVLDKFSGSIKNRLPHARYEYGNYRFLLYYPVYSGTLADRVKSEDGASTTLRQVYQTTRHHVENVTLSASCQ